MTESNQATIQAILTELQDKKGALLPILHAVQNALSYIPPESVPTIAAALNLSRAEHGSPWLSGVRDNFSSIQKNPGR